MRIRVFLSWAILFSVILPLCTSVTGQQPASNPAKASSPASSQQPPAMTEDEIVRITTNLVQIDAVVTKDSKQITNLTAADFQIFEDGKPQTITNFAYVRNVLTAEVPPPKPAINDVAAPVTPAPLEPSQPRRTIALVVDDLGISMETTASISKQLRRFVMEEMQPNDLVAIIRTGGEVGALQQFTTDKRLLERAIDNLKWNSCSRAGISIFPRSEDFRDTTETGLSSNFSCGKEKTFDALRFILSGLREIPGRKSMVIFSEDLPIENPNDSLPRGRISPQIPTDAAEPDFRGRPDEQNNARSLQLLAELAIRSSVVVYGVDIRGLVAYGPTAADLAAPNLRATGDQPFARMTSERHRLEYKRTGLEFLSRETGGFLQKNSNDFGLDRIAQDQSGYYLIGYRPTAETFDRRFHHISIKLKRPGLTVRTRAGFYGMTDEEARPKQITNTDRINAGLMSPFGSSDIEIHLTALFADVPNVGPMVRSLIHVSGSDLKFTEEADGWHKASVNLAAIVFGDNGMVVHQVTETRAIRLKAGDFERVLSDGLVYQADVLVNKPGTYQFRVAVRDENSSLMGSARELVSVPDLTKDAIALSGITLSGDNATGSAISELTIATRPSSPAIRRFRQGANLWFGYSVYNARINDTTRGPMLTAQARIFLDGRLVYAAKPKPIDASGQIDLRRIAAAGGLRLGSTLDPGKYQLQIVVTDSVKPRERTATQWIDFQIVN